MVYLHKAERGGRNNPLPPEFSGEPSMLLEESQY
jgi:hypothetical protein